MSRKYVVLDGDMVGQVGHISESLYQRIREIAMKHEITVLTSVQEPEGMTWSVTDSVKYKHSVATMCVKKRAKEEQDEMSCALTYAFGLLETEEQKAIRSYNRAMAVLK